MLRTACCAVLIVTVAGCSHPSSTTYGGSEVGQTIETSPASVVSSRLVDVAGEPGFVGAGAGAAVGAAGGGLAVNGPASLLVAIVGGLVGAGIGYMAEKGLQDRDGIEYILQMDDGRLVTIVQNREGEEAPLPSGTPVLLQLAGQYTRVLPHPAALDRDTPAGWVDPDASTASSGAALGSGAPASSSSPDAAPLPRGGGAVPVPGEPGTTAGTGSGGQQQ